MQNRAIVFSIFLHVLALSLLSVSHRPAQIRISVFPVIGKMGEAGDHRSPRKAAAKRPKISHPEISQKETLDSNPKEPAQGQAQSTSEIAEGEIQADIHPEYPRISRAQGEEGEVLIEIQLSPEGSLIAAEVAKSSSHPRLDQAALAAVRSGSFQSKIPLTGSVKKRLNIVFRLNP